MPPISSLLRDWLSGAARPPIAEFFDLKLLHAEGGTATIEVHVSRRHHNPTGTVHGGVFADLADAAMGSALAGLLADGEAFTTTDLAVHFLVPVREGTLRARATVVRRGRSAAYIECDVQTADVTLVAKAQSTCLMARTAA